MSVGTEEANRLVVQGTQGIHGKSGMSKPGPLVQSPGSDRRRADRLLDRARGTCAGCSADNRSDRAIAADAPARRRARPCRPSGGKQCRRRRRRRSGHRLRPGRRLRLCAKEIGPHLAAGAIVSDVGSVKGAVVRDMAPHLPKTVHFVPAHPVAGTEYSGTGRRLCGTIRQPVVHSDAAGGRRSKAVEKLAAFWRLARRQCRHHGAGPSRSGARHHQPSAASDCLHDRRHCRRTADGDTFGSAEILGRRIPRLHAHRRIRPNDVARRVPRQQGSGLGDARPLQ